MAQKITLIGAGALIVASIVLAFFNTSLMQAGMAISGVVLLFGLWTGTKPGSLNPISTKDAKTWGLFVIIGILVQFAFSIPIAFITFGPAIGSIARSINN